MRALYEPNLFENSLMKIEGERFDHLKVVRIREGEEVLLLDGKGQGCTSHVEKLHRNFIELRLGPLHSKKKNKDIDVLFYLPKKEAFKKILQISTELGVKNIISVKGMYSRPKVELSDEKIKKILISSLEQSNNYFLPNFNFSSSIKEISLNQYSNIYYFCSQNKFSNNVENRLGRKLIIIGSEAGLHETEETYLEENQVRFLHLDFPILRAPTALAVAIGHVSSYI